MEEAEVHGRNVKTPYDVVVVGAGPAGSTTAYYLAASGIRVALLEKARFPRDKYCGDAWCAPALDILEEMGVLQALVAEGLVRDTVAGGFVSPAGESYVSTGKAGGAPGTRCYAIKRLICDERIARRAAAAGAELIEGAAVTAARLEADGFWTVGCSDGSEVRSRLLVAADGANSRLARLLGVVTTKPDGYASRRYVRGGTHNFRSDGVLFYPEWVLPGYVALFRHFDDDIDVGCYVIQGGTMTGDRLAKVYDEEIARDPFLARTLGPQAVYREPARIAPLRTGGVPRSTARQFLAVGDAAGQTDPLTGEGIHTGMIGGRIAAETVREMFERGDFSERACQVYHQRWLAAFGNDFRYSAIGAALVRRSPLLLDAANVVAQRRGDDFMVEFGAAMTGVKPKTTFLKLGVALPVTIEIARQVLARAWGGRGSYASRANETTDRPTAFRNACLLEAR